MAKKKPCWIWYPGDLENYHALKQNFSRVERGMGWPAYWKSSGFRQRVVFWREYDLEEETTFRVTARGCGFVRLICEMPRKKKEDWQIREISREMERKEYKHRFGEDISCGPGHVTVVIHVGRIEALPSAFVEGDVICTDLQEGGWLADDYGEPAVSAGQNTFFTGAEQDPAEWPYREEKYFPVRTERVLGGTLYEWETELTAVLEIRAPEEQLKGMMVYPGESREEALDTEQCYLQWKPEILSSPAITGCDETAVAVCPRCAVRFVFIPGEPAAEICARHQFVEFPEKASFQCDDPLLNRIWEVASHTFRLCAGIFFIDGIKRDQWIWGGDAYQSFFVNRYLLADPDIEKRTLLALRGNDPVMAHINTIIDYSLFWILAVMEHVRSADDMEFLREIYPKMASLMEFCENRTDADGFLTGKDRDWTYIDWAELDKTAPAAGEQMLLSAAYGAMAEANRKLEEQACRHQEPDSDPRFPVRAHYEEAACYRTRMEDYLEKERRLREKIRQKYWSEEKGAFIDSFTSGKNFVSRQTNILALRTGQADEEQTRSIREKVLNNADIPPIRTPYFQFYALDAMGELGEVDEMIRIIREYWGGMLSRGAVTFWEEYDPGVTGSPQYDMYGDRFGKSLCHIWASSPIYLISRYIVGLRMPEDEDGEYVLEPRLSGFRHLECTLPAGMKGGNVKVTWDGSRLRVKPEGVSVRVIWAGTDRTAASGTDLQL